MGARRNAPGAFGRRRRLSALKHGPAMPASASTCNSAVWALYVQVDYSDLHLPGICAKRASNDFPEWDFWLASSGVFGGPGAVLTLRRERQPRARRDGR